MYKAYYAPSSSTAAREDSYESLSSRLCGANPGSLSLLTQDCIQVSTDYRHFFTDTSLNTRKFDVYRPGARGTDIKIQHLEQSENI